MILKNKNIRLLLGICMFIGNVRAAEREEKIDNECILQTFQGPTSTVCSVAFHSNGTILVLGALNGDITLWDIESRTCLKTWKGHARSTNSVALSPDSNILASGSNDGTVKLWNMRTGQCIQVLNAHGHYVHSVAFSPDNKALIFWFR